MSKIACTEVSEEVKTNEHGYERDESVACDMQSAGGMFALSSHSAGERRDTELTTQLFWILSC